MTSKNNRNHRLLIEAAPHIDCDGFEFLMYDSWYSERERIADELTDAGLSFPVFHTDKAIGELISRNKHGDNERARRLFEINCETARRVGSKKLVLHLWGGIPSDRNMKNNVAEYAALSETAKKYGLLLTVENVVCNNHSPLLHFAGLKAKYPDAAFTFDTKFAKFHNQLDAAFGADYGWMWHGAVRHVHVSDYDGGYKEWGSLKSLHPGEGKIDFEKVFSNLRKYEFSDMITLEATSVLPGGGIDVEKLNKSLAYLRELTKKR